MREKLGKYELIRRIGGGSYGLVYEAFDPHLKRPVAIKICTSRDETARQRFYREAEIAGNLVHPNITTVHDFGFHGDVPFLVEEFLQGEDLDTRIRRQDPMSLSQQLDYLVQAAAGLGYAHANGIVHRDVKPSNVRILANDSAKILDFGTAKRAESESQLTQSGTTVGTAAYLSPEILRGHEASSRSDIFSFGVLAYELLSGSRPFPGRQIAEVLAQILHEEPVPLRRLWSECPSDLDQIITRCLSKEIDSRYRSCADVATELERCIINLYGANGPTSPRPTPLRPKELEDEVWLELLIERARDLARARELPRALVVLATAKGFGRESEEVDRQYELLLQRLQRRSRTGVPSDRHQASSDESVDKALTEMRAVLYIGNIEGVEEAIRRHRDDLSSPEVVRRLRVELSTRLAGIRAAIATAAESVVEDGLTTAKRLLAEQRLRGAARLLRALRPIASGDDVESTLHVVSASQRHTGDDQRSAEVVASIEQLLNQNRPVEAAAAMRFALRLYGAKANLGPLVDHLAESFRDEVLRLRADGGKLVAEVTDLCQSAALTHDPPKMRTLLQVGLDLRADDGTLLDLRNQLLRRDGGKPMLLLIESARAAAGDGDPVGALTSLLAAYQLAPENAEILALLTRCGASLLPSSEDN